MGIGPAGVARYYNGEDEGHTAQLGSYEQRRSRHSLGRELIDPSLVVMKERKTTSTLKRILVTCAVQAKDYGACIAAKVPEIERDACLKEFHALRSCMQKLHQGKR